MRKLSSWSCGAGHGAAGSGQAPASCDPHLKAKVYCKLGQWEKSLAFSEQRVDERAFGAILGHMQKAAQLDPGWYKAWHNWALMHYEIIQHYDRKGRAQGSVRPAPILVS